MSILHNDGNQTRKVYPSSLSKRNAMAAKESMWAHTGKDKGRVVGPNGPRPESQELRVLLIYTPRWELENQGPCLHHLLASFTWLCTIWGILCLCLSLTTFPCSSWHNLQEIEEKEIRCPHRTKILNWVWLFQSPCKGKFWLCPSDSFLQSLRNDLKMLKPLFGTK